MPTSLEKPSTILVVKRSPISIPTRLTISEGAQVLPSQTGPLGLLQPTAHCRIVHTQAVGNLPQSISVLPIGCRNEGRLFPSPLKHRVQWWSLRVSLTTRNFLNHAIRLMLYNELIRPEIDLPTQLLPGAWPLSAFSHKPPIPALRLLPPPTKLCQHPVGGEPDRPGGLPGSGFPPGTELELNGKGTTAGFNASFLYTPWRTSDGKPRLSFAGIWRSQAVLPLNGTLLANGSRVADASTSMRLPEVWTGGIAYWPVRTHAREWKVEVDVDYVRWQTIRDASVLLSNGSRLSNQQQWKNTFTVNVGTEYKWVGLTDSHAWDVAFRTGYIRSHSPVTDLNFDPAFADNDVHVATVGMGVLCRAGGKFLGLIACADTEKSFLSKSSMGLDVFYQAFVFDTRTVTRTGSPAAPIPPSTAPTTPRITPAG